MTENSAAHSICIYFFVSSNPFLCQDTKNLDATPSLCKVRPKGVTTLRQMPQSGQTWPSIGIPPNNFDALNLFPFVYEYVQRHIYSATNSWAETPHCKGRI
eukprot:s204_g4.t1